MNHDNSDSLRLTTKDKPYRKLKSIENAALQLYKQLGDRPTTYVHPFSMIDPENEPKLSLINRLKWNKAYESERLKTFVQKTGMNLYIYLYTTIPYLNRFPILQIESHLPQNT